MILTMRKSVIAFFLLLLYGCKEPVHSVEYLYDYHPPIYNHLSLIPESDTLQFNLDEAVYNEVKSHNLFREKGVDYISFYDRRSESINIYYWIDQRLYKNIPLKKFFKDRKLYKVSVFVKSWDSIWVTNQSAIYLYDSSGRRLNKIEFPDKPVNNVAVFENNNQPVFIGNRLFAITRSWVNPRSINSLREWKVMYQFDLEKKETKLLFHLPVIYQKALYGYPFLNYNFCYNPHGKFVLSFPADTLLYETDLIGYNHAYFARSQTHQGTILPVSEQALKEKQELKEYAIRDSYGSVLFDSHKKCYLRLARHKISPEEYEAKKKQQQTVLIMDEQFRIIGESGWSEELDFESLFFTRDGKVYARTNKRNENALQFVQLKYHENAETPEQLTSK